MKIVSVVHPRYSFLKEYIEQLPKQFDGLSEVLYHDRNIIKADEVTGLKLVIKSYGRIYLTNKIRYSFFYPSKAERAYSYGLKLLEKGFYTPQPIAFIECYQDSLLTNSYFISEFTDFMPLASVIKSEDDLLIKELTQFTHRLHSEGIYHMDFSAGNILCKKENGQYKFALIDNNRMRFGRFSYSLRLKNFQRLGLSDVQLVTVAREYSRLENANERQTIEKLFRIVRKHEKKHVLKKRAKKLVFKFVHSLAASF
jgi:Lipopolysaccharide kinase (Kdo/WaaP) family